MPTLSSCDLHIHSNCSDGSYPPEDLITLAREAGVGAVALCDHNTVAGLARFEAAARGTEVAAVPGIEISADYGGREVHILGLFLSAEARVALSAYLEGLVARKIQSNRDLVSRLATAGYALDYSMVEAAAGEAVPNRVHVAKVLLTGGYIRSIPEAFERLLADNGPYYRSPEKPVATEVIELLGRLGAVPVLAHPLVSLVPEILEEFLPLAKDSGLVAMETLYPEYTVEEAALAAELAARFGILLSGGSDFHGKNRPDIDMGRGRGDLSVPMSVYKALRTAAETKGVWQA